MCHDDNYEYDSEDPIVNDCGESTILCKEDAVSQVRRYNQILEERFGGWKKIPSRSDPSSILHGL